MKPLNFFLLFSFPHKCTVWEDRTQSGNNFILVFIVFISDQQGLAVSKRRPCPGEHEAEGGGGEQISPEVSFCFTSSKTFVFWAQNLFFLLWSLVLTFLNKHQFMFQWPTNASEQLLLSEILHLKQLKKKDFVSKLLFCYCYQFIILLVFLILIW